MVWLGDIEGEIKSAIERMTAQIYEEMFPLFIGPITPETHASGIVLGLMYAAGYMPNWGVEDDDDGCCCGCCC